MIFGHGFAGAKESTIVGNTRQEWDGTNGKTESDGKNFTRCAKLYALYISVIPIQILTC